MGGIRHNMKEKPFLAIDLGAGSGRVFLGSFESCKLEVSEVHRFENRPIRLGGVLYWDFLALWDNVIKGLALCASRGAIELAAIGIDSWNLDFALLGEDGMLLGNPISYRDQGAEWVGKQIASTIGALELYQKTGIPILTITGLARLIQMCRGRAAEMLDLASWYLPIPDLVRFFLTGDASIEETIAWGTQLVDVSSRTWSLELIDLFGIPKRILPELVSAGTIPGSLSQEITEITGLNRCPVATVAEHDTASAVFIAHHFDPEAAILSAGTWSIFGIMIDAPLVSREALEAGFLNEIAYQSIFFGKNLMGFFLLEELLKSWRTKGNECDYDALVQLARTATPGSFLLDPNDPLFFSPSNFDVVFHHYCEKTNQKPVSEIGKIARALYEGLAASYAQALHELSELLHRSFSRIVMVGGGVRNGFLCQLVADACGVEVMTGPAEATVTGNLCVQALALGRIRQEDLSALLEVSFEVGTYHPAPR